MNMGARLSVEGWLSIVDYANKYQLSISTLRRRIRDKSIRYELVRGKYFLIDESPEKYFAPKITEEFVEDAQSETTEPAGLRRPLEAKSTNLLLNELKLAYQQVLREKEEQIFLLKEEISNLQTLIRVLEEENVNLKINRR